MDQSNSQRSLTRTTPRGFGHILCTVGIFLMCFLPASSEWQTTRWSAGRKLQTAADDESPWVRRPAEVISPFCDGEEFLPQMDMGIVDTEEQCLARAEALGETINYAVFNIYGQRRCFSCLIKTGGSRPDKWENWTWDADNSFAAAVSWYRTTTTTTMTDPECGPYPSNSAYPAKILDGYSYFVPQIVGNFSHRYQYVNKDLDFMDLPKDQRKLLIHLEACVGVVYLFVRKTRPCYPDPYTCIDIQSRRDDEIIDCGSQHRTHFVSEVNGTRDGAPTWFEIPLTATNYYITVFAAETSAYTLTVMSQAKGFPLPGNGGKIDTEQVAEQQIKLSWETASIRDPAFVVINYHVYVVLLAQDEARASSPAVFLRKDKVLNTVCGLDNNTRTVYEAYEDATNYGTQYALKFLTLDKNRYMVPRLRVPPNSYTIVAADLCTYDRCNITINDLLVGEKYAFNVIAETADQYMVAYAGTMNPEALSFVTQESLVRRLSPEQEEEEAHSRRLAERTQTASLAAALGAMMTIVGFAILIMMKVTASKDKPC